ncbi:Hypothetical protein A7982_00343 [Minicystis rosea]|nr:Hypothetical protein A7982_00343 [Minicystis rosea]
MRATSDRANDGIYRRSAVTRARSIARGSIQKRIERARGALS